MAGGRGLRLRPLTDEVPKPLLEVGGKPVIQYQLERLAHYGVRKVHIAIHYRGEQLKQRLGDGSHWGLELCYIEEPQPLGTIGALGLLPDLAQPHVLVMNADLLTDAALEQMYAELLRQEADLLIGTVPYEVELPYAVLQTQAGRVVSLQEKPTYTYQTNAGIYFLRREQVAQVPRLRPCDATEWVAQAIDRGRKVVHHPITNYWLDIGQPEDLRRAQIEVERIPL